MKLRSGFVSNSSSTSFAITNTSSETKTLVDFAEETQFMVDLFIEEFGMWAKCDNMPDTRDGFLKLFFENAEKRYNEDRELYTWEPGKRLVRMFGDEDGDVLGAVYDYMLRNEATYPENSGIVVSSEKRSRSRWSFLRGCADDNVFYEAKSKSFKWIFEEWNR